MTNFKKVDEFHNTFSVASKTTPEFPEQKVVDLRVSLIAEELDELKEAIEQRDLVEVADALADILYVTYGAGLAFGLDLDHLFDVVHKSNMDKTCDSEEHAQETVEHYASLAEPVETYYKENNGRWLVFRKADNKVLKRKGWSAPDLAAVIFPKT